MSQRRFSGLSDEWDEGDEVSRKKVTVANSVESDDLYTTFQSKLDPQLYTVKAQLDDEGKATSFEVFRVSGDGQPRQKVFSSDDKTKTCSFSQPFDPAIINTYVEKAASQIPEKILQISSCESFDTLTSFLDKYNESSNNQQVQFHVPPNVVNEMIEKEIAKLNTGKSFEDAKNSPSPDILDKTIRDYLENSTLIAKPEAVKALLAKRRNIPT